MANYKRLHTETPRTVRFDAEQLKAIVRMGKLNGLSFGAAVRLLISEALASRKNAAQRAA